MKLIWESINVGPKLFYLGIFRLVFEKRLVSHLKQLRIFQNVKFHAKLKNLNIGSKYPLFESFVQYFQKVL